MKNLWFMAIQALFVTLLLGFGGLAGAANPTPKLCPELLEYVYQLTYDSGLLETFGTGDYDIDINGVYTLILLGQLDFTLADKPIANYVKKNMEYSRAKAGPLIKKTRAEVTVNRDYLLNLSPEHLEKPGVLMLKGRQQIIIDGNHRATRRYLEGHDNMAFFIVKFQDLLEAGLISR